eukprot:m.3992 g.3992  ORF g.3992 m.3992 type:complete len:486 (+) comp10055_c0_seq1:1517-2974(+)
MSVSRFEERLRLFEESKRGELSHLKGVPRPPANPSIVSERGSNESQDLWHGKCFPLEMHLGISPEERVGKFLEDISVGVVVLGEVLQVQEIQGVFIKICEISVGPSRYVKDLELQALCPTAEIQPSEEESHVSPLEDFKKGDFVRGIVYSVVNGAFFVSFRQWRLPDQLKDLELGLLSEDDTEIQIKRAKIEYDPGVSLSGELTQSTGFSNPHGIDNLRAYAGISASLEFSSFLQSMQRSPPDHFYDELRSQQTHRQAMDLVASGVSHLKSGKAEKAVKYFDQSLLIEPQNVEAYVARGALHANDDNYYDAIKDFKSALKFHANHRNAKKYLAETQLALGNSLAKKGKYKEAVGYFRDALALNPNMESAAESLKSVEMKIEIEAHQKAKMLAAAKRKEKEDAKRATSLYKLRQLIVDEEEYGPKPDKKKKKKKERHKKHKKEKKRLRSPSGTTFSSDTDTSDEGKRMKRRRSFSSGSPRWKDETY